MVSTRNSTRSRRIAARVAIAGALAVVPLAAVAGPALADTVAPAPSATQVDWHQPGWGGDDWHHGDGHHGGWPGGGWHHGWPGGGWHHGPWMPGPWGGDGGPWMPDFDTGSAG